MITQIIKETSSILIKITESQPRKTIATIYLIDQHPKIKWKPTMFHNQWQIKIVPSKLH